jgi:four helix bundle protein
MKIERFEDIEGWKLGRQLTAEIYRITNKPPFSKDFGLKDQIQRSSGSIMHNVAEGFDSGSNAEFVKFLRYSQRSCTEVQSQLYVALDQSYINVQQFQNLYDLAKNTHSKTGAFIKYLVKYEKDKKHPKIP